MTETDTDTGLVVLTNREPYVHDAPNDVTKPVGGLTAAMDDVMREIGGTWVAHGHGRADFDVTDSDGYVTVPPDDGQYSLKRLDIPDQPYEGYYYGYSNQVLWPLCHEHVDRIRASPDDWTAYTAVNEQFAGAALDALARQDDDTALLWVHDYHLALVPELVRRQTDGDVTIQHFWHIPWPPAQLFDRSPHAAALLTGLLGNDRIGFHTHGYAQEFLATVERTLPDAEVDTDALQVTHEGRTVEVYVAPVGIDTQTVDNLAESPEAERFWRDLREREGIAPDERIAVSVDRLDYTKGILQRLDAVEHLLERDDSLRGSFRLLQKGSPTREQIPEYERYQRDIFEKIRHLNDRFGTEEWQPVVYLDGRYTRAEISSLYRNADVCIVSPLADGYNLVAQEYVAANQSASGALVLSKFAGVHTLIGDDAFTINPHDTAGFAAQIEAALDAPKTERAERFQRMYEQVAASDIGAWMEHSLGQWSR
ncbi:Alpha,alpha-trehalose-phosphate synthase (UDP- forming) [Haloferax elongans ATCC BAA-1513]|uniref:Alpha,alpha-trehalose-phosphate synthase (UDP-forming) n=1 Tax=Haloferax elongans ATCC BAA-1513 TaxID=1230453 RepID=M0HHH4_HALEO|nr:trehalose-6-phosphate synthase [Haloferax elongans]ELZ83182.1 Alpha,alpha-trehalose-phosphate synthase (UDP- forming) [Haloferax elongans ATCC BAA-1513]